ncbi:MAG: MotA/TolQ/ExbB proton channel family protein [Gammaproteobacteria bacterium]
MDPTEEEIETNVDVPVEDVSDTSAETEPVAPEATADTTADMFDANLPSVDAGSEAAVDASTEAVSTGLVGDIWSSASNIIELGGPVVTILIVISIFGFAVALFKFFQFSSLSASNFKQLHQAVDLWGAGDTNAAKDLMDKVKWPLSGTMQFGLTKQSSSNEEQLREELTRQANEFLNPYAKFLRPLELIYYLAPVLGLLGTVLGMIEAFKGLEASTGLDKDSTALAGGIWEALLTTAVGLSIAIPFTMIHAWLESRLDSITDMTSDLLTRVVTLGVSSNKS